MTISQTEAVASLHVLVAVAQADGTLHEEERRAIESALETVGLSEVISAREIFADVFDIEEQIAILKTPEARDETFRSAYSLAYADGACSSEEKELLKTLRVKLGVTESRERDLAQLFAEKETEVSSQFQLIPDEVERGKKIASETRKASIFSALLGAAPWPGLSIVTDLAVVYLQVGLVRDIAAMHGRPLDKKRARSLLAGVGIGTGARIALSNIAKLLPGWGSIVGATTSFASTYAVGKVFHQFFESGAELDAEKLKAEFGKAQAEGKEAYKQSKEELAAKEAAAKAELQQIEEDAKAGRITHEEIGERISRVG